MELIKEHKIVIVSVLILLVLILIRSTGLNHFKSDAKKWAEPSLKKSNILTIPKAGLLAGKSIIINFDKNSVNLRGLTADIQNIPADSVLSKKHITNILKHDGPVLLFSSEPGLSARIWMIIRQMGCKNIYILTDSVDNEALRYKFHPDSLLGTRL